MSVLKMNAKICIKCNQEKPVTEFCLDSGYSDGRRSECNKCRQDRRRVLESKPSQNPSCPVPSFPVYTHTVQEIELPPPERLPAAYLKRCADYWFGLIDGDEPNTRIA